MSNSIFALQMLAKAVLLTISWMGTSPLALVVGLGIGFLFFFGPFFLHVFRAGFSSARREYRWTGIGKRTLVVVGVWAVLIAWACFHTIPHEIRSQAQTIVAPRLKPIPTPWSEIFKNSPRYVRPTVTAKASGVFDAPFTKDPRNLMKIGDSSAVIESIRGAERDKAEDSFAAFDSNIYIWKELGRYRVSATIRDEDGNLALQVVNNRWQVFPRFVSDKNYNDKAFEVKDNHGRIIFQVAFLRSCIEIQSRLISGYGQEIELSSPQPSKPAIVWMPPTQGRTAPNLIRPIFEYPSTENLGKMSAMGKNLNCEGKIYPKNLPAEFNPHP